MFLSMMCVRIVANILEFSKKTTVYVHSVKLNGRLNAMGEKLCPKCGSEMNKVEHPDEDEEVGTTSWLVCENELCGHEEKVKP